MLLSTSADDRMLSETFTSRKSVAGIFTLLAAIESIDCCFDIDDAYRNVGCLSSETPQRKISPLKVSRELKAPNASFLIETCFSRIRSSGKGLFVMSRSHNFSVGGGGGTSTPSYPCVLSPVTYITPDSVFVKLYKSRLPVRKPVWRWPHATCLNLGLRE